MRKLLFTILFALTAIPGLAWGQDQSYAPPVHSATIGPPIQLTSPYSPIGVDSLPLPRPAVVSAGKPATDPVLPCSKSDWAHAPSCSFWVSGEFLLWWIKDSHFPPLVTTGVPGASILPGVLGQVDTRVLFGGTDVESRVHPGGRFSGGFWLNDCQTTGVEASYFFLGSQSVRFDGSSTGGPGSPLIARPFFDVLTGVQNAQLVAFPGIARGDIHAAYSNRLQGAELNLLCVPCCTGCCDSCAGQACRSGGTAKQNAPCNTCCGCNYSWSMLGGIRYLQLDEGLGIVETSVVNPELPAGPPIFGGSTITIADQFDTHNYFYGAQIGARAEFSWGPLFADVRGKLALGATHEVVEIHGVTEITSPGGVTVTTPAGFLASGSNSGQFTRDVFAVVPEVGIDVGCQITHHLRASVGYTFLYWSAVVRPGDQIDVSLSGTQIPTDTRFNPLAGPVRPGVLLKDTDFWAQGVSLGLEFRY